MNILKVMFLIFRIDLQITVGWVRVLRHTYLNNSGRCKQVVVYTVGTYARCMCNCITENDDMHSVYHFTAYSPPARPLLKSYLLHIHINTQQRPNKDLRAQYIYIYGCLCAYCLYIYLYTSTRYRYWSLPPFTHKRGHEKHISTAAEGH